jgi:HNH endonuclease
MLVKPSRAAQNKTITCGPSCLTQRRKQVQIVARGSADKRVATCGTCGNAFERKPSQIAKYGGNYCGRECSNAGKRGPKPQRRTGQEIPCEVCGRVVMRTPATRQKHTFCSRKCAARSITGLPSPLRGVRRKQYPQVTCAQCGNTFETLPWRSSRFCSRKCRMAARKGVAGRPWPDEQRSRLSQTLKRKYSEEWADKPGGHARKMAGERNPAWIDGRTNLPYTPGFFRTLKNEILKRDGYECQACGRPKVEPGTHVIHHLDLQKTNHDPSNLLTLCGPCHGKLHGGKLNLIRR